MAQPLYFLYYNCYNLGVGQCAGRPGTGIKPKTSIRVDPDILHQARIAAIIKTLDLRRPIYKQTAAYGHFGREDLYLPWEKTDKADILRKEAGL